MSFVNFSTKEITSKIVYYGPGLCGKTTTLQYIYDSIVPENKGQLVSLATDVDRTIYFDFLPLRLGKIQSFSVRIQLYTVPGQVRYNSTRKLVLSGTDGVVFVADSQRDLMDENLKSHRNLLENLRELGLSIQSLPHVFQYNKRDLPNLARVEELNQALNPADAPWFETCATTGEGVLEGLKTISKLVMQDLNRKGIVSRKRHAGALHANRTDAILKPLVGFGADDGWGPETVVEEYDFPFARAGAGAAPADAGEPPDAPAARSAIPDDDASRPAPVAEPVPGGRAPGAGRRGRSPAPLSFAGMFDEPGLAGRIGALEERVQAGDGGAVQKLARELFYTLIEDQRFFPPDMTESSRVSMLGISLRKYAHFYRLLSQPRLTPPEGIFLLHFLIDVQFGKGMP